MFEWCTMLKYENITARSPKRTPFSLENYVFPITGIKIHRKFLCGFSLGGHEKKCKKPLEKCVFLIHSGHPFKKHWKFLYELDTDGLKKSILFRWKYV